MNLAKIVGVPMIIFGGLGTLYGIAGTFAAGLQGSIINQKIERMCEYRNYIVNKNDSEKYNSISNEIHQLKEDKERLAGYAALGLVSLIVSGSITITGFNLIDKGEKK